MNYNDFNYTEKVYEQNTEFNNNFYLIIFMRQKFVKANKMIIKNAT